MTIRSLMAEIPSGAPGCVAIVERRDGEILRSMIMRAEEGQQLGFDLCRISVAAAKAERVQLKDCGSDV